MRYPEFAKQLKAHGTPTQIMERFGFKWAQTFKYLKGETLPRPDKLLQLNDDLIEAAKTDVRRNAQETVH